MFARRWAARLYPRTWRQRYGEEFDVLLEDAGGSWRDDVDILIGGLEMHLRKSRLQLGFALAGLLLGAWIWGLEDSAYVARVEMTGAADRAQAMDRAEKTLSLSALVPVVNRYDLYRAERSREPIEFVLRKMQQNIAITSAENGSMQLSFTYPDPGRAQHVAETLAAALDYSRVSMAGARAPRASWWIPCALGLLGGILVGVLWSPEGLRFALWCLVGSLLAYGASWLIEPTYRSVALIRAIAPDTERVTREVALFFNLPLPDVQRSLRFEHGMGATSLRMALDYKERYAAQRILSYALSRVADRGSIEILDPPLLPQVPISPNRYLIALAGLLSGGVLYVGWSRTRPSVL